MIIDDVRTQLAIAAKSGEVVRLGTLRMMLSALEYRKSQKLEAFSSEDEMAVVVSEAKKRQEAIDVYTKYQKMDRVENEKAELKIIEEFLPTQVSEEEIDAVIAAEMAANPGLGMGPLTGKVMGRFTKGTVDGALIARLVAKAVSK